MVFKIFLKNCIYHGQYGLTHIVFLRFLKKFPPRLLYFLVFKRLLKICIWDIMLCPILPFTQDFIKISTKNSYSFWCSKIYSKNYIRDNMVWPILPFQGSYVNVHLMLINILILKRYWKIVSGTLRFHCYFPFRGFYQVFIKDSCFFLFQKSLRNLNRRQIVDMVWPISSI